MIYIVEDDASIRELEQYALQSNGYEVQGFESAEPFWQAMRAAEPELVILDVMLPGEDGFSILKKLQKSGMVRGYRGVHGGYSLNCDLDQITLYDVYTTIDPGMFIIDCLEPGYDCARNSADGQNCSVHCELAEIQEELCRMLKRKSLKKLING